jgi:hypothetical protein
LPDFAAALGFAFTAAFFLLLGFVFFLLDVLFADIAWTSRTGSNGTGDYTDAPAQRKYFNGGENEG